MASRKISGERYAEKVTEIAKSDVYKSLKAANPKSDDFYELDGRFESILRREANLLGVSSAKMERDISAAYQMTA